MRRLKYLLVSILIVIGTNIQAQDPYLQYLGTINNRIVTRGQHFFDGPIGLPYLSDTPTVTGSTDRKGIMIYVHPHNSIYVRDTTPGGHKWSKIFAANLGSANNGLSTSGGFIQFGQSIGASGNPAVLLNSREVPMGDFSTTFKDGILKVETDHQPQGGSEALFQVRQYNDVFTPLWSARAKRVAQTNVRADTVGYTSQIHFNNDRPVLTLGTDGPAKHIFFQSLTDGPGGGDMWFEDSLSSAFAAFEADGDISLGVNHFDRNVGIGHTNPQYKLDIMNPRSGVTASNRLINAKDSGITYNTTSGAITNEVARIFSTATRTSGVNSLTNMGLRLSATGGSTNYAMFVDSGQVVIHNNFNTSTILDVNDFLTVNNALSTQNRSGAQIARIIQFNDTAAMSEVSAAGAYIQNLYRIKGSFSLPDNQKGSGAEIMLNFRRNTAYTGTSTYTGSFLPTNDVTTMPSALSVRFSAVQNQTGGNALVTNAWFAGITSALETSLGNRINKFVYFNGGAGQAGGLVDTAFTYYANALASNTTTKYAFYNAGSLDSNIFNGPTKVFSFHADKTITAPATTGNQTINKISGTVNFAAAATTLTVTNSFCTTSSLVFCTIRTNDATAIIKNVVPGSGSFVITLNAAATAETSVGFFIVN